MAVALSDALCVVTESTGRHAVAARHLKRGEVVLRTPALAGVLLGEFRGRRCDYCFGESTRGEVQSTALSRCGRCRSTYYCGRLCQMADWKVAHKFECPVLGQFQEALVAAGHIGDGAFKDGLLAARCIRADASNCSRHLRFC